MNTNVAPTGRHVAEPKASTVVIEMFAMRDAEVRYAGDLHLRGRHAMHDSWDESNLRVLRAKLMLRPIAEVLS